MEQLKVLELFAGIGACSKALTNLGIPHKIVDAVEIDKYAIKSFNAIHGTNFPPQDITKWDKDIEVDFIMHGSPCQDFSVAGKGAGGDKGSGTRSSLMYETIRIVDKLRPKYVLWENVKNLLSEKHRPNYFAYIKAMTNMGYKSFGRVLNAKDFGVPQNRERIYTLSIRVDDDPQFEFPEGKPLDKRLRDVLEDTVDEKYYLTDKQVEKFMNSTFNQYRTRLQEGDVSQTILARDWKDPKCVRIGGLYDSPGHKHQAGSVWHTGGLVGTLSTMQGGNQEPIIIEDFYKSREPREYREVAPTLRSERSGLKVADESRIRKLTPKDGVWYNGLYEERYKDCRKILPILWEKIGEEAFCEWAIGGLWCVLSESVLWERVYAKGVFENWIKRPELVKFAQFGKIDKPTSLTKDSVRDMWIRWQNRCSSYRWELSEQQLRQFESLVQKLPHEVASFQGFVQGLWEICEGSGVLREALSEIQKIWKSDADWQVQWPDCRIRKLTPRSCWRLMGFDDEAFDRAKATGMSNSALYKQAGNSIVVNVLEAIFKELFHV